MLYSSNNVFNRQTMSSVRLNELTDSDLPARLSFCDFIYGATDTSFDVSSNDLIDIHFFKRSVVAHVLLLPAGRKMVKIPLNADFKITFVPEDIDSDCILTATQIVEMAADRLPKILIVKKGCKISADHRASKSSSISSLFEGELLIIKNRSNNIINCFSFLSKSEKLFDKTQSDLVFSVNPSNTKLSFSDLIHLDTAGCLPLQIKLHPSKKKLERWFQMPCTIYSLEKEDSVIASLHTKTEKTKLYEISSAIPIDFIRVSLTKHEGVLLLEKSLFFYENFNPSKVKIILDEHNEKLKFERETYQMLKSGNDWNETIEIFKPAAICSSLQSTKHGQILSTQKEIISSMSIQEAHDQSYYALLNPVSIDKEDNCYAQHIHQYEYTEHVQPASYYNHPMEIKPRAKPITNRDRCSSITDETRKLELHLEKLSIDQVLELLSSLGISQYTSIFVKEQIYGALLQELDEEILEKELGMSSRLHRLKLMRVIDGRQPLDELLHNPAN